MVAVIDYLFQYCPPESGLMVFKRISNTPGYEILGIGDTKRNLVEFSGLQLVIEKMINDETTISCDKPIN